MESPNAFVCRHRNLDKYKSTTQSSRGYISCPFIGDGTPQLQFRDCFDLHRTHPWCGGEYLPFQSLHLVWKCFYLGCLSIGSAGSEWEPRQFQQICGVLWYDTLLSINKLHHTPLPLPPFCLNIYA